MRLAGQSPQVSNNTEMSSSPSASPVSAGSDNSTDYFRDAVSQQLSLEGLPDDVSLIPSEALAYVPKPSDILKPNPGGHPVRLIFGDLDLVAHELAGLREIRRLMANDKELQESPIFADDRYTIRFLQGNDWDASRCIVDMKRHLHWRAESLPIERRAVEPLLRRGFIYIHGRDHAFRPILVLRCKRLAESQVGEVMPVVIYWLEFTLARLLVKNKVEQWRVVIDLEDCSITSAPISILKQVCDTLTRNYRGRLFGMLILNAGFVFRSIWQLVSVVLPERTRSKIKLTSSSIDEEFLASINRNQIEERYGGKCPDVKDFSWPVMPSGPYNAQA